MTHNKILYVDDEKINLMLLKLNLRDKYEVITTDCALEGLEILKKDKDIAIVISDMKMPNISGLEFVTKAKMDFPKIKFFVLTGLGLTQEINEAMSSGILLDYFKKPFDPEQIIQSIDNVL